MVIPQSVHVNSVIKVSGVYQSFKNDLQEVAHVELLKKQQIL